MDKRKLNLLKYLLNNCNDGYKILDVENLLIILKKYKRDSNCLLKDIKYLSTHEFIDVKYSDEQSLCLRVLDNSRVWQDNFKRDKISNKKLFTFMFFTAILSGVMAFLGAMLSIMIFG